MTPEQVFDEVADTLSARFSTTLSTVFKSVLRELPGVWEHCVSVSEAVENEDEEALSEELRELDELVSEYNYGYAFEDLEYRLQQEISSPKA